MQTKAGDEMARREMTMSKCECGADAVNTATEWTVTTTPGMDLDATAPGYRYGGEVQTPVCYGMGPQRYEARDYMEHVLRLARQRRSPAKTIRAIEAKVATATIESSARQVNG